MTGGFTDSIARNTAWRRIGCFADGRMTYFSTTLSKGEKMKPKAKPIKAVLKRRREKRYHNKPLKLRVRNELRTLRQIHLANATKGERNEVAFMGALTALTA